MQTKIKLLVERSYDDVLDSLIADATELKEGKLKGWKFGWDNLTENTGRIDRGQLIVVGGYTGCFVKGTPVLTSKGYIPIDKLKKGDLVATYDGKVEYNPVDFVKRTCKEPKPMISFKYDKETITATYDHPFFDGEKYHPLYQFIWGKMEASQRIQLELLCKQYGQTLDHSTIRGVTHSDNETWEGQGWVFKNCFERQNNESSQNCCTNLDAQSPKLTVNQSQRQQSCKQLCGESGMVYSKTEQPTCLQAWKIKRIVEKGSAIFNKIFSGSNNRNQKILGGTNFRNTKEPYSKEKLSIKSIAEQIQPYTKKHFKGYSTRTGVISKIQIKETEPYYGIGVKNVHTYIVGYSQLPVHNTGKTAFVLNLVDGLFRETKENKKVQVPKVAIFSTEISSKNYVNRHILLRMQTYKNVFVKQVEEKYNEYSDTVKKYREERKLNPGSLEVFGDVSDVSQIEAKVREKDFDIVIIDYVQMLNCDGKSDPKDTMPNIASRLFSLMHEKNVCIVAVSQINNYGMGKDNDPSKTQLMPFTFGKELVNAAHTAILLSRKKEDGQLASSLQAYIVKAREGSTGLANFYIHYGYYLIPDNGKNEK